MLDVIKYPVEYYLEKFTKREPFQFARYGDGEVLCMFHNDMKANCDGSKFLPQLTQPMKQIFINQFPYYHCLLRCSFDLNGTKFKEFIEETCPDLQFYDGEIWQELSFGGRIEELTKAVSLHENPIFIGGSHFQNIHLVKGFVNAPYHLQIPDVDSFLSIDEIMDEIANLITDGHRTFLFSAGYTTKIIIDELYPYVKDDVFLVDVGSVFDPYCGKLSRSGMRLAGFSKFQPFTNMKLV